VTRHELLTEPLRGVAGLLLERGRRQVEQGLDGVAGLFDSRRRHEGDHAVTSASAEQDWDDFPEDESFSAAIERTRYRPATVSEGEVTQECLDWLAAQPECLARKVHQAAMSGAGEPDLDICWQGRCVKIELKAPGGDRNAKPTKAQHARLLMWQRAGALVGWARSVEELRAILGRADDPAYRYTGKPGAPDRADTEE
jgi:hypothetical protein